MELGFHAEAKQRLVRALTGVAVAQRQLRHSDAATTLRHYGHILGNDHREAVEAVEAEPSSSISNEA